MGGAIGNLADRLLRAEDRFLSGEVIDFIDVSWYAVFNVADMFVVCGAFTFAGFELVMHRRAERDADTGADLADAEASAD
jgi:signal peptidase II